MDLWSLRPGVPCGARGSCNKANGFVQAGAGATLRGTHRGDTTKGLGKSQGEHMDLLWWDISVVDGGYRL